jgi:hypothetical protein
MYSFPSIFATAADSHLGENTAKRGDKKNQNQKEAANNWLLSLLFFPFARKTKTL